jgi:hypothetical protein
MTANPDHEGGIMTRKTPTPATRVSIGDRFPELRLTAITGESIPIPDHSTATELRKYQDDMPFPVIGDPDKTLYHRFGVEASAKAVLNPRAWRALPVGWRRAITDAVAHRRAPLPLAPTNGNLGLPADLLITADGSVAAVKYGAHAYDQWSVDELLDLASGFGRGAGT